MFFRSQRKSAGDVSLSDSIDADGEGNDLSFMDIVCEEEDIIERISGAETGEKLRLCIGRTLTDREAEIVRRRYGLDGAPPQTQRDVALACGISRSYVSRIEKKALEKLREAMGEDMAP